MAGQLGSRAEALTGTKTGCGQIRLSNSVTLLKTPDTVAHHSAYRALPLTYKGVSQFPDFNIVFKMNHFLTVNSMSCFA